MAESKNLSREVKDSMSKFLLSAASAQHSIILTLPPDSDQHGNVPVGLERAEKSLTEALDKGRGKEAAGSLPNRIKFPYSRHSSYRELCHFLDVLKPKDIWPCTVDPVRWIKQGESQYSRRGLALQAFIDNSSQASPLKDFLGNTALVPFSTMTST